MSNAVVFIHGAWHDYHTWDEVAPILSERGLTPVVFDLPGAGANAKAPSCYQQGPRPGGAFATEPSPNAGVSQQARTEAVISAVREANARTGSKALLVAHSMGGLTACHVAEHICDEVSGVVFVSAFLPAPGVSLMQITADPMMGEGGVQTLFRADPQAVGALRIDYKADDPDYLARIRQVFCGDLDDSGFEDFLAHAHPDEPAQVIGVPSPITVERFGSVPRHYVKCLDDRLIPVEAQSEMIHRVDAAMGNETGIYEMSTSHSPFHADPARLAEILAEIAAD